MPILGRRRTLAAAAAAVVVLAAGGGLLVASDGEAGAGLQVATPRLDVPGLPVPGDLTAAPVAEEAASPEAGDADTGSDGADEAQTVSVEGGPSSEGRSADEELDGGADADLGAEDGATSSGAPSDEDIARELRQLAKYDSASPTRATLTSKGNAVAPTNAPAAVRAIIAGGNLVARKPYVYGGGHNARFVDTGYDCSGSISYALATAGLIRSPMASGPMSKWGRKGRGRWVTIYANASHAFMVVAGVRFDTSGRGANKSRWQAAPRSTAGFTAVHPPGL